MLFLIYMNDAYKCLAQGTDMGVHSNDTTALRLNLQAYSNP